MGLEVNKFMGKKYYFKDGNKYTGKIEILSDKTKGIKVSGFLEDGVCTGEWYYFDDKGNTEMIETYEYGELNGMFVLFYPNGNIKEIGLMKQDKRDGMWYNYYFNGNLKYENHYVLDVQTDGIWKEYTEDGYLLKECPVMYGKLNGTCVEYDKYGNVRRTYFMRDGLKNGYEISYDYNNREVEKLRYVNGVEVEKIL